MFLTGSLATENDAAVLRFFPQLDSRNFAHKKDPKVPFLKFQNINFFCFLRNS